MQVIGSAYALNARRDSQPSLDPDTMAARPSLSVRSAIVWLWVQMQIRPCCAGLGWAGCCWEATGTELPNEKVHVGLAVRRGQAYAQPAQRNTTVYLFTQDVSRNH